MKKTIITLTVLMLLTLTVNAETVAYWRLEEGSAGSTHTTDLDGFLKDSSGYSNHMSRWYFPGPAIDLPSATVSQTGMTNERSLSFCARVNDDPNMMAITTHSKPIDSIVFSNGFTIECATKTLSRGWNTVFNKEGKPTSANNSPFKILFRDDSPYKIGCDYIDAEGTVRELKSSFTYEFDKWYFKTSKLQDKRNSEIIEKMAQYEKFHPTSFLLAYIESVCGKYRAN